MKLLTLNFLTCALKACKPHPSAFPLHPRDAELEIFETELNLAFLKNILPRLMWDEIRGVARELGLPDLPETMPSREDLVDASTSSTSKIASETVGSGDDEDDEDAAAGEEEEEEEEEVPTQTARDLHRLLLETCIQEGKLVCGNCGHEYAVKEGVANFLLPGHLV